MEPKVALNVDEHSLPFVELPCEEQPTDYENLSVAVTPNSFRAVLRPKVAPCLALRREIDFSVVATKNDLTESGLSSPRKTTEQIEYYPKLESPISATKPEFYRTLQEHLTQKSLSVCRRR